MQLRRLAACACIALLSCACSTVYYDTLEQFGVHKREILVDRVEDARASQVDAAEQFTSALEKFRSVADFDGGDLERLYNELNRELERSQAKAARVTDRVNAIEDVADALFEEWAAELSQYNSDSLRAQSQLQLDDTRGRYREMLGAMRRAEARIAPALAPFADQVLFLKHNLNAQAIASLRGEVAVIEADVESLISELAAAVAAADAFIASDSAA